MPIYCITNNIDNRKYYGKTEGTVETRWKQHLSLAKGTRSQQHIYRAMRKYGIDHFSIQEVSTEGNLNAAEQAAICAYGTHHYLYGFNETFGGEGVAATDVVKQKIAAKLKGNTNCLGRTLSPEHKAIINQTGRKRTPEQKQRMRDAQLAAWNSGKYQGRAKPGPKQL